MYNIKDSKEYLVDLLKRKGITGAKASEFLAKHWGN